MTEKDFQKILLEALDSALSSLGDSAKQSIYFHLENRFKITKDEIPRRLDDFDEGLEKIFGPGTRYLEILIMKKLHEKAKPKGGAVKLDEKKELKFIDYVKATEHGFSKKKKST